MGLAATRTTVVKNLNELFWYIQPLDTNDARLTIVTARAVTRRCVFTAAAVLSSTTAEHRGAGHTEPTSDKGYVVALTAIRSAAVLTLDAKTTTFVAGDPPGTAVVNQDDSAVDLTAVPTVATATADDMVAIVEQPKAVTWDTNGISYVTAATMDPPLLRRDIRDKGQLQHRKKMAVENGILNLTALYENAKQGLSKYVDQNIIVIGERIDNRIGVVTEKYIFYGAYINSIPAPTEAEGDTDTNIVIPISYELLAIVGESYTA